MNLISSKKVRIGKSDDLGYSGKYLVTDWSAKRITEDNIQVVDKFNLDKKVINSQIKKAGGIQNYNGQIMHISTDTSYKYAPSDLFPVLEECLFEKESKHFRKNNGKFGFLNGKIVLVGKMTEDEEREFRRDLERMQGGENASNLLIYQATNIGSDLTKMIKIENLSESLDDEILKYSDEVAEKNICKAFTVPLALVNSNNDGIFGNSGEMLKQMKIQLYESKEYERMLIVDALNKVLAAGDFEVKNTEVISPF